MPKFVAEEPWVVFAATQIFSQKISEYCIESAKTINEMTLNELIKLTTLWTTGPRCLKFYECENGSQESCPFQNIYLHYIVYKWF